MIYSPGIARKNQNEKKKRGEEFQQAEMSPH
jgi:hypothetical protein